jgi:hypothetical protein
VSAEVPRDEDQASGREVALRPPAGLPEVWDAGRELQLDRRSERRLFVREVFVLIFVGVLIVLRVLLVHGS